MKILALAILASVFAFTLPAAGQGAISPTLSINPGLVKQTIKPGEKTAVKIKVTNLGKEPVPLSASKFSISGINNLGSPEFTAEPRPHSGVDWLTIDSPDLILDAESSKEVQVTILAPKGTVPGGYSAALIFQARLPSNYFDEDANTRIIPALSTSFLLSVDSTTKPTIESLSISSFQTPKIVVSTPVPLLTEVSNPTGFFFFADGDLTLTPTWGEKKMVTQLASSVLMPESSRQYISAYTGTIWPGVYDAKLTLRQDGKVLVASSRFVSIPWPFIIIVLLSVALVVGSAIFFRRRRARGFQPSQSN
ncbi:MAG: hypothetical protein AAB774_02410 [Patescibacteria group bacterium]